MMRKHDQDWVKKLYGVEGKRPVGRPRSTWLESVEADMAELEIDKEDATTERNKEGMLQRGSPTQLETGYKTDNNIY